MTGRKKKPTPHDVQYTVTVSKQSNGSVMVVVTRSTDQAEASFVVTDADFGGPSF